VTHAELEQAAVEIAGNLERKGFADRELGVLLGLVSKHFHHPQIKRRPPTIGEAPKPTAVAAPAAPKTPQAPAPDARAAEGATQTSGG
jgi:hypothetical protein